MLEEAEDHIKFYQVKYLNFSTKDDSILPLFKCGMEYVIQSAIILPYWEMY